jgi:hypothetical protein
MLHKLLVTGAVVVVLLMSTVGALECRICFDNNYLFRFAGAVV